MVAKPRESTDTNIFSSQFFSSAWRFSFIEKDKGNKEQSSSPVWKRGVESIAFVDRRDATPFWSDINSMWRTRTRSMDSMGTGLEVWNRRTLSGVRTDWHSNEESDTPRSPSLSWNNRRGEAMPAIVQWKINISAIDDFLKWRNFLTSFLGTSSIKSCPLLLSNWQLFTTHVRHRLLGQILPPSSTAVTFGRERMRRRTSVTESSWDVPRLADCSLTRRTNPIIVLPAWYKPLIIMSRGICWSSYRWSKLNIHRSTDH